MSKDGIENSVCVDIEVSLPEGVSQSGAVFSDALIRIDSLFGLQRSGELTRSGEKMTWASMVDAFVGASDMLELPYRDELLGHAENLKKGIYDLYPVTLGAGHSKSLELIIGKVFISEGEGESYYAGAACVSNEAYSDTIYAYDSNLERLRDELPVPEEIKGDSVTDKVPEMKCVDVFSLTGALDLVHKPICIFYSGGGRENLSSLSNLSVFINLYTNRFRTLTMDIADKYLMGAETLHGLSYDETARLLLIWLRGHDTGHFMGPDRLSGSMSEFDPDYMCIHELKSDMIALFGIALLKDGLLSGDMLVKAYLLTVAEMLRYIRRPGLYEHPDSASAYVAFRYFLDSGAILFDPGGGEEGGRGKFEIDADALERSVSQYTAELLHIFADGDVERAREIVHKWGNPKTKTDGVPESCPDPLSNVIRDCDLPRFIEYDFKIK